MEGTRTQTMVGALGLAVLVGLFLRVFLGSPVQLRPGIYVQVSFSRSAQLQPRAPVKLGPIHIGHVEKISLQPQGGLVVTLFLEKRHARFIPRNSRWYMDFFSPVGNRHIAVELPDTSEEPGPPVRENDRLRGEDPFPLEYLQTSMEKTAKTLHTMIREAAPHLQDVIQKLKQDHGWVLNDFLPKTVALAGRAAHMEPPGPWLQELAGVRLHISPLSHHAERAMQLVQRLQEMTHELEAEARAWQNPQLRARIARLQGKIPVILQRIDEMQTELKTLEKIMKAENGTLHAFMRDTGMYNDLRQMARRLKNAPLDLLFKRTERRPAPAPTPDPSPSKK